MKDSEYELLKNKITKLIDKWLPNLGLKWWNIDFYYDRENSKDKPRLDEGHSKLGANTYTQYPYKTAQIDFFLPALSNLDGKALENLVLHELIHILVNEMRYYDKDSDHEERVVSDLTSAFLWTYKRVN